jgi:hypothetical protein
MPPLLLLPPDTRGDHASFTDESSISGYRYMVVGGVSCSSAFAEEVDWAIRRIRAAARFPQDSLQWKHFRPEKFPDYKRLIDYFLKKNEEHYLNFSCLVIDKTRLNHRRYNDGDAEAFFQKMMYQYALALAERYGWPPVLRCFHGRRVSKFDLVDIRRIINSGISQKTHFTTYRPLRQLEYMDVERSGPHQISDILIGAVSYYWNTSQQRRGLNRKRLLAEYIKAECCASTLAERTPMHMPHFDIWPFRLRENPRA